MGFQNKHCYTPPQNSLENAEDGSSLMRNLEAEVKRLKAWKSGVTEEY